MNPPCRFSLPVLLALLLGALSTANAQPVPGSFGVGLRGGFYMDDGAPAIGATALIPLADRFLLEPAVEVEVYDSRTTRYAFDVCGRMNFPLKNPNVVPYVEAGVGYEDERYDDGVNRASQGNVRINAVGGAVFNHQSKLQFWGGIRVFGALRAKFATEVVIQAGALYWF